MKTYINLFLTFIVLVITGTLTHELGHIVVAKSLNYNTELHYASMSYDNSKLYKKLEELTIDNQIKIQSVDDLDQYPEYNSIVKKIESDGLLITLGGTLQTILTGSFGFLFLILRLKKIQKDGLGLYEWFLIFLSLFWLRQLFNMIFFFVEEVIFPNGSYFGGDERKIATALNLWPGTFSVILSLISIIVFLVILFKIIPSGIRLKFIFSGISGGIIGIIIWMNIIGPVLIP